jgi:hypothetical protein
VGMGLGRIGRRGIAGGKKCGERKSVRHEKVKLFLKFFVNI